MKRRVIILTLSEKWGKKCVAACDADTDQLVRLVSTAEGGGIPNGCVASIRLLDIVEVEALGNCPLEHQRENVLIDLARGLRKVGRIGSFEQLARLADRYPPVFGGSSYKVSQANAFDHSLEIVRFESMNFFQTEYSKTKANFSAGGCRHTNYSVTDRQFFGRTDSIPSGYAVISLPPSDDFTREKGYFKYISAIY